MIRAAALAALVLCACARAPAPGADEDLAARALGHARAGELHEAEALYRRALALAPPVRRPRTRAGLAAVLLMNGRSDAARAATAACLPGAPDAAPACLFVAALADVERTDAVVAALGAAAPGARLLAARALVEHAVEVTPALAARAERLCAGVEITEVPLLASYGARLRAQVHTLADDAAGARAILAPVARAHPDDVAVLLQLAMAQAAADDRAGALAAIERVFVAWPHGDEDAAYLRKAHALHDAWSTL